MFSLAEAARLSGVIGAFAAAAIVVLAAGLVAGLPAAVTAGLAGLGACWAVSAWTRGPDSPGSTIFVTAAILAAAELAFASLEQATVADEGELVARRLAGIVLRAVGALVLASLLLAALGLNAGGGLVLEAVGVAAAVGLLLLLFTLARDAAR
ncbi:MAG TPA: hypothetical protein VNT04_02040 [Gaiellaceae bacterium]|nr:hypothetical protein [Gaiellaceae bacterium]